MILWTLELASRLTAPRTNAGAVMVAAGIGIAAAGFVFALCAGVAKVRRADRAGLAARGRVSGPFVMLAGLVVLIVGAAVYR